MAKVLPTEGSFSTGKDRARYEVGEDTVSRGGKKVDRDDNNIIVAIERTKQPGDRPRGNSGPFNAHFVGEDRSRPETEQNDQIALTESSDTAARKQSLITGTVLVRPVGEIASLDSQAENILMASSKPDELPDRKPADTDLLLGPPNHSAIEEGKIAASVASMDFEMPKKAPSRVSRLHNIDGSFTSSLSLPPEALSSKQAESVQSSGVSSPSVEPFGGEKGGTDEESVPKAGFTLARRGTRRLVRRSSRDGGHVEGVVSNGKQAPFTVPRPMFMGHPAGSKAAEFLERHERRVEHVRSKREEVGKLIKLVMDHNPESSGSPLPDVDKIFPVDRSDKFQRHVWV